MPEIEIKIRVSCYAGYKGEETPQHFFLEGRRIEVEEVLDSWLAPDHRYFKLRGDDEATYILRYDTARDYWGLVLYDSII